MNWDGEGAKPGTIDTTGEYGPSPNRFFATIQKSYDIPLDSPDTTAFVMVENTSPSV
jgi:hypothetical protein